MSTDERVASRLVKTLENGRVGFEWAADRVEESDRPDLGATFRKFSSERAALITELETLAAAYGDDVEARSTAPGLLHRGWMAVKDTLTGRDVAAVINTAEQGEDHALEEYRDALEEDDLSPEFRAILARQMDVVRAAHDHVRNLKTIEN
jgi:uncharacterized protein (TIGR02284 family)